MFHRIELNVLIGINTPMGQEWVHKIKGSNQRPFGPIPRQEVVTESVPGEQNVPALEQVLFALKHLLTCFHILLFVGITSLCI